MLWKELLEIEDCEACPLKEHGICPGGWTSSPSGDPIEPPCTSFKDDTDLDDWIGRYYKRRLEQEELYYQQMKKREERRKKNEVAKRRRNYLKSYCWDEQHEVNRLRKLICATENQIRLADTLAIAFNTTNEMFGYSERVQVSPQSETALEKLKKELEEAESKLKVKQGEGKKTKRYLEIR